MHYKPQRVTLNYVGVIKEVIDFPNSTLRHVLTQIPGMIVAFNHGVPTRITIEER